MVKGIKKPKLLVILGPTASGKSELALILAKKYKGEIISADSRQVYKHLDIGSNKVPGKWKGEKFIYKGIQHHCIDFVDPKQHFSVAEFKQCADAAITDIQYRQKIPILVGGTGLYIDAVADGMVVPAVAPDLHLRKKLELKSASELFRMLQKKDPVRAASIDPHNTRRLIRALEIIHATKQPIKKMKRRQKYDMLILGIKVEPDVLKKRIEKRAQEWIQQGLLREAKKLIQLKIPKKRIREFGFNYRHALDYLDVRFPNKENFAEILAKENWRYVKRQMTWFKRDKRIHWISKPEVSLILPWLYQD